VKPFDKLLFSLQNAKLTQTACVHLPASLQDHLMLVNSSHHYRTDPRVLDILLRHWRRTSLQYPLRYHHHILQQPLKQHVENDDDMPEISLRELSLDIALAFISAVGSSTLLSLNTLYLTEFYTGWVSITAFFLTLFSL